jgi:hypothetical protein
MDDRERIGNIPESMTNKRSKYTIYNIKLCELYEKLSILPPPSSNRTQLRLHSNLLLRFGDVHVLLWFIPASVILLWKYRPDICGHDSSQKEEVTHITSTSSRSEPWKKV